MYFYKINFYDHSGGKERWHNVQMLASDEYISPDEFEALVRQLHGGCGDDEVIALKLVETGRFRMMPYAQVEVEYRANDEDDADGSFVYRSRAVSDPYKTVKDKHNELEQELKKALEQRSSFE